MHRAQQGEPTDDPILLALTDAQRRYTIPAGLLDELAMGTAMDVVIPMPEPRMRPSVRRNWRASSPRPRSIRTFERPQMYCYRVASVVGLVCIHIFGYRDPAAEPLAEQCGLAFQLTNIIRDVKEDAAMGRVYFPEEDLAKFGLSAAELLSTPDPSSLSSVAGARSRPRPRVLPRWRKTDPLYLRRQPARLWVLVNIYRRLLEKIAERQYDVFSGKVSLTVSEKLRVLGKGFPAAPHLISAPP